MQPGGLVVPGNGLGSPNFGKTRSARSPRGPTKLPETLDCGQLGKTEWGERCHTKNPNYKADFNRIRWANVDAQLDKIKRTCAAKKILPAWALISVETGYGDYKKIGLEIRPQTLPYSWSTWLAQNGAELKDMMRGKEELLPGSPRNHKTGGDMDGYVEINGPQELTWQCIQQKAERVLLKDIDPVQATENHSEKMSSPRTFIPSPRPKIHSEPGTTVEAGLPKKATQEKGSPEKVKEVLRQGIEQALDLGADDAMISAIVQEIRREREEANRAKEEEKARQEAAHKATRRRSQTEGDVTDTHKPGKVVDRSQKAKDDLRLIRNADACAWIVFHMADVEG